MEHNNKHAGGKNEMKHRILKTLALTFVSLTLVGQQAFAQEDTYPSRTVEVINQFGPGGGTDMFIRTIGVPFEEITGQSLVGISIAGGGGVPAATQFFNRPADGHSLMAIGPEEVINHLLGRIDANKFMPVARIQYDQALFYVREDSPFNTIQDVVEHAKKNPGSLSIAITGAAGYDETVVGLWNIRSKTELSIIPFNSASEAVSAVLGGHTDLLFDEYGPTRALIEAGRLRPLVLFAKERLPELDNVPTARELGFDVTLGRWRGFALVEGNEPAHADALSAVFEKAVQDPRYKKVEEQNGLQYRSELLGPDEFKKFLDNEIETYRSVLERLGYIKS